MMTSSKPYLVRAFYEWIVDNGLTPYIAINADTPGTHVPTQYVEDGRIVLNISPSAAQGLLIDNEFIEFKARFSGVATRVYAPVSAVLAIYARENGRGMVFGEDEQEGDGGPPEPPIDTTPRKPKLTIVK
jgi:stringent starvation protein B